MKITSCDCFETIAKEDSQLIGERISGVISVKLIIENNIGDMTSDVEIDVQDMKYCPFCGNEIEVEDE